MATYISEADSYAGFGSTGKYFGYFGLAAGAIGLMAWAVIHRHLLRPPAYAADRFLIVALMWVSSGLAVIMAAATLGSLVLSSKSRGTVTVDDLGVTRMIGDQTQTLRWAEIEGFVVTPIGEGITLIPCKGRQKISIPSFLNDYRGCITEIKARGLRNLPSDNPQVKRAGKNRMTWKQVLLSYACVFAFSLARNPRGSHALRLLALASCIGYIAWVMTKDQEIEDHGLARWISGSLLVALLAWLAWDMMHTW